MIDIRSNTTELDKRWFLRYAMETLTVSCEKKDIVKQAREKIGWNVDSYRWLEEASKVIDPSWEGEPYIDGISESSWKRFLYRLAPIKAYAFKAYCEILGIDWQEITENASAHEVETRSSYFAYDDTWVGRDEIVRNLIMKLRSSCRILVISGLTGIGKTALAERLTRECKGDWIELCRVNFDDEDKVSDFVSVAAELLNGWQANITPNERQDSERLLILLINFLKEKKCFLLIDSLEKILKGDEQTGWSNFKDDLWRRFFQSLLSSEFISARIILTSQDLPSQLEEIGIRYPNLWHCQPLSGLTAPEQLALFQKMKIVINSESKSYLQRVGAAYEGHPLALRVIAGELMSSPFYGNITAYWKKYGCDVEELEQTGEYEEVKSGTNQLKLTPLTQSLRRAIQGLIERTLKRLAQDVPNAYILLCHGAVYRRPVPEDWWLEHLVEMGLTEEQQEVAMNALRDRYLVELQLIDDDICLRQHNLVRSVALFHLKQLITKIQSV